MTIINYGSIQFRKSFNYYLEKNNFQDSLFLKFHHEFKNSKDDIFLQMADLVAGSLACIYDEQRQSSESEMFKLILKKSEGYLTTFPRNANNQNTELIISNNNEIDNYLSYALLAKSTSFIFKYETCGNHDRELQACALRILIIHGEDSNFDDCINTTQLIKNLVDEGVISYSEIGAKSNYQRYVSNKITGPLRDNGIIITGTPKGLKLAVSISDINEYLKWNENQILPRIGRISKARDTILNMINDLDIVNKKSFPKINAIVESLIEAEEELLLKNNYKNVLDDSN